MAKLKCSVGLSKFAIRATLLGGAQDFPARGDKLMGKSRVTRCGVN
jgi:hypothetical protein